MLLNNAYIKKQWYIVCIKYIYNLISRYIYIYIVTLYMYNLSYSIIVVKILEIKNTKLIAIKMYYQSCFY